MYFSLDLEWLFVGAFLLYVVVPIAGFALARRWMRKSNVHWAAATLLLYSLIQLILLVPGSIWALAIHFDESTPPSQTLETATMFWCFANLFEGILSATLIRIYRKTRLETDRSVSVMKGYGSYQLVLLAVETVLLSPYVFVRVTLILCVVRLWKRHQDVK